MTKEKLEELNQLNNLINHIEIYIENYLNSDFLSSLTHTLRYRPNDYEVVPIQGEKLLTVVNDLNYKIKELIKPELKRLLDELKTDFNRQ